MLHDPLLLLEWSGALAGLAGALLLAMRVRISRWGWVAFLASNILLIVLLGLLERKGLVVMQTGFLATSLLGLYRNFLSAGAFDDLDSAAVDLWLARRGLRAVPCGPETRRSLPGVISVSVQFVAV